MNNIYAIIVVFALLVIGGFYFVFDRIANLRSDFKNLELSFQLATKDSNEVENATNDKKIGTKDTSESVKKIEPIKTEQLNNELKGITIPTAIIFEAQSSPLLQPQTKMTVTVDNITKGDDGIITLNLKVFSSEATSYSAFEARDFFEVVRLDADNQKPLKAEGQFNSIPPKSAIYGTVIFKIDTGVKTMILQVGSGTNLKFYEFDFEKKSYKETVIG